VSLRRELAAIPPLPTPMARAVAARVRLPRSLAMWRRALRLARAVLQIASPEQRARDNQSPDVLVWRVDTAALWERLVHAELGALGKVGKPSVPSPWAGGEASRPDHRLVYNQRVIVADSKYKTLKDGGTTSTVSRSDAYQLFAYSHLVEGATACALIYPCRVGEAHGSEPPMARNPGPSGAPMTLTVCTLPFPARGKLSRWHASRATRTAELRRVLGMAGVRSVAASPRRAAEREIDDHRPVV
jgi:hypothetical protein